MRLERVTLAGVLRFDAPVTLDFAALPAGLVAVVGANGEGKTTLVESAIATLFRAFPSRSDRQLLDYAHGRDAYLETVFSDPRGTYRARVNLDAAKRSTDAVLELTDPSGVRRLLNDGKVSTYDAAVAEVFPPLSVLLASVVAAQNRHGSFLTLDKRGRKDLFVGLLGLDRYEAMAATARQAAALVSAALQVRDAEWARLEPLGAPAVGARLADAEATLTIAFDHLQAQIAAATDTLAAIAADLGPVQDAAAQHAAALARRDGLDRELDVLGRRRDHEIPQRRLRAEAARDADLRAITDEADRAIADLEARRRNNDALLTQAAAIRDAVAQDQALDVEGARLAATRDGILQETRARQADQQAAARAVTQAEQAQRDHAQASRRAALIADVPCQGQGGYAACRLLSDAEQARQSLPALATTMAGLEAARRRLGEITADLAHAERRMDSLGQEIAEVAARRRALAELVAKAPRLEHAAARIAELDADLARVRADAETRRAAVQRRCQAEQADSAAMFTDVVVAIDQTTDARLALEDDIRAHAEAAARAAALLAEERRLTDARSQWRVEATRVEGQRAQAARESAEWRRHAERLAVLQDERVTLRRELDEWNLLARAFGRDGLPVLEIDAAGPTVSAYANDLMSACFGPRFTVQLVTQVEKADGRGLKEVFDLRVIDNLRGGDARDLTDLSGGEQVLVDEALKNALALFCHQRQTGTLDTCVRDECTAPLDAENAVRYVEMLRRVQRLGGFHHIVMVSHSATAAALADVRVRVADGRVAVDTAVAA